MSFDIRPARVFDDVATILAAKNPDSPVCWCLTYRLSTKENSSLSTGQLRAAKVAELCGGELAPGVLAYDGDEVVGWAGVAPRSDLYAFARANSKIPHVDELPVWTVWCFRVRAGHRKRGIALALLEGAVGFARENGAPAIEGYPVDNGDKRVNPTMAYVGTKALFARAGFVKVADTTSVSDGFPRVVMRRTL